MSPNHMWSRTPSRPHHLSFNTLNNYFFIDLFFTLAILFPTISHSLVFNISRFQPSVNQTLVVLEGDATVLPGGDIQLTELKEFHVGRVVSSEPLRLWDSSKGNLADFTTGFSFRYDIQDGNTDDGLAFFLAPVGYPIPPNSAGTFFGLLNFTTIHDISRNQIVMVEFDSYPNDEGSWDPKEQHVGINVNSVTSVAYAVWNATSNSGKTADVCVSYNATTKNLSVTWSYGEAGLDPANKSSGGFLSHVVDLKTILPELVTVGISAATGLNSERHIVRSWNFNSSLDLDIPKNDTNNKKKRVILLVIISVILVNLLVSMLIFWLVRRNFKNRKSETSIVSVKSYVERGYSSLPRTFTYQELVIATNGFADERKLGRGGSGHVYKGTMSDLDRQVAVKRIFGESEHSERFFFNEVKVISRVMHRNLVQFIGWCQEQNDFLLVYEYMPNGSLDTHLFGDRKTLPWDVRYKIALGLASALNYLHEEAEQCVLHRDIKPENVLLDTDFTTKLGDFGVAKLVDPQFRTDRMTALVGTFGYLAPEYANFGRVSKESDMYSFGVVALEIACGRRSVYQEGENHVTLMRRVWELYFAGNIMEAADERLDMVFDPNQMEALLKVGLWCTNPNERERPKAGQAIKVLQLDEPLPELAKARDLHCAAELYSIPGQQTTDSSRTLSLSTSTSV